MNILSIVNTAVNQTKLSKSEALCCSCPNIINLSKRFNISDKIRNTENLYFLIRTNGVLMSDIKSK